MQALTEKELKESFGIRVKLPVGLINYRAYEESVKGIEAEIKEQTSPTKRARLFKIRSQMKKVLNEL